MNELELIAPCGMNCNICSGYLREKNKCLGCREKNKNKPKSCQNCIIINCNILKQNDWKYCSDECEKYPCLRLKTLDKRYKTRYNMSMLENLKNIKELGIKKFVKNEKTRWTCKKCKGIICVHNHTCSNCGETQKTN